MLFFSFFLRPSIFGQEKEEYKFQLEASTSNDAFIVWENFDRYYTYGAGFKLRFKSKRLLGLEKLFPKKTNYFFSAGFRSEGYTPTRKPITISTFSEDTFNFERPFAGLLFGTFSAHYTFNETYVQTELFLGIMGPSAYSRNIQDWIHDYITDDDLIDGWQYQIPDQVIFNINLSGAQHIYTNNKWLDIYAHGEIRLGNLYVDATPLLGFRFGKFAPITKSSAFGNGLLASKNVKEFFIRSTFSVTAVGFNGTAQGNMFNDQYDYKIDDLSHFHATMSHGLFYAGNRFSAAFDHVFTFGKVNQRVRHIYGRFIFNYRF